MPFSGVIRVALPGMTDHVGSTVLGLAYGREQEVDVVVTADDGATPGDRTVVALDEAKVGETITMRHVEQLEHARKAIGLRASGAKLLLFGGEFEPEVVTVSSTRPTIG